MEEFYFDDAPIEAILYGGGGNAAGPSLANLYLGGCRSLQETARLCQEGKMSEAIESAAELGRSGMALSASHVFELDPLMSKLVRRPAMIQVKWNIAPLEPLIERLWQFVREQQEMALYVAVEPWLYRFYEHQGRCREARRLQHGFIEFYRAQDNRDRESRTLNNLAFEYQLEERWSEATTLFEEAARISKEIGNDEEHINSRANYWICRFFGLDDIEDDDLVSFRIDLEKINDDMGKPGSWFERKPLLLFAKAKEREGRLDEAVKLVRQAIESSGRHGTRYGEMDRRYLEQLMLKKAKMD